MVTKVERAMLSIEAAKRALEQIQERKRRQDEARRKKQAAIATAVRNARRQKSKAERDLNADYRKKRTRGLIVLGGWVMRNDPGQLQAALLIEQEADKHASLEFLDRWVKDGGAIDE